MRRMTKLMKAINKKEDGVSYLSYPGIMKRLQRSECDS